MAGLGVLARLRRPSSAEVVAVSLCGHPAAVAAVARALAGVTVVTDMSHHVSDGAPVRLDVTCYPAHRTAARSGVGS